jgi:hypothetical protein
VIHHDPALGQQLFHVPVGQAVRRYQRTATVITSRGKRKPANAKEAVDTAIRTSLPLVTIGQRNTALRQHPPLPAQRDSCGDEPMAADGGREQPGERSEECSVDPVQLRLRILPSQYGDPMPKHQQLGVFRC